MRPTDLKWAVIIPARFASSRFPGKPLVMIEGKSLINRVWERCVEAVGSEKVYIATDNTDISQHVEAFGGQVIMTSESCMTGTDRVYEAATTLGLTHAINVQGDEPLLNPDDIKLFIKEMESSPNEILNGMARINDEDEFRSSTVPKVVADPEGKLLYMSRAAIPTTKKFEFIKAWKQICIYVFPMTALKTFTDVTEKTELENIEDIEILRFLEQGYSVKMLELESGSAAVDVPEDVAKIVKLLNE